MLERIQSAELGSLRKSTVVAQQILRAIQVGEVLPGEKLPSERIICERLGVSRGVVREALSALQISGIVQIRTGEGTYVNAEPPAESSRGEAVLGILEGNESPLELWEARREIESVVICAAAKTATSDDHQQIGTALAGMREALDAANLERYLAKNGEFHRLLAKPADNSVLKRIANDLIDRTEQLTVSAPVHRYVQRELERSFDKHAQILDAYRQRDIDRLRGLIHRHFETLEVFFLEE